MSGNAAPDNSKKPTALSPQASACAAWIRQLVRGLKTSRLYAGENPVVRTAREQVASTLGSLLAEYGAWTLRFTPTEIFLGEESVVRPQEASGAPASRTGEEQLAFTFYSDGIRTLTFLPGIQSHEIGQLFQALVDVGRATTAHDDIVTLLWQANFEHIRFVAVPIEQVIYLDSREGGGSGQSSGTGGGGGGGGSAAPILTLSGSEIRAELGQKRGAQGLHRDTFDDWELPHATMAVIPAHAEIMGEAAEALERLQFEWTMEHDIPWTRDARDVLKTILALDPTEDTRMTVVRSAVTWTEDALREADWDEVGRALDLLIEIDPGASRSTAELTAAIAKLPIEEITERLDEGDQNNLRRFCKLSRRLGAAAIPLVCGVLGRSASIRTRAAACVALYSVCSDDPALLEPYLADRSSDVVRSVVYVLGSVGGSAAVDLLRLALQHSEAHVRKEVVMSLAATPVELRVPILVEQLDTADLQFLTGLLGILTRERNAEVAAALLRRVQDRQFESLDPDLQRALLSALGEVANDAAVPALDQILRKGGLLARRSQTRTGVARALRRIGTPKAIAALEEGAKSRFDAIRLTCQEALAGRQAS